MENNASKLKTGIVLSAKNGIRETMNSYLYASGFDEESSFGIGVGCHSGNFRGGGGLGGCADDEVGL